MIVMNAKKFHFASHDHSKCDYPGNIISVLLPPTPKLKQKKRQSPAGTWYNLVEFRNRYFVVKDGEIK